MPRYTRLTLAEREEISRLLAARVPFRAIARQLRRAPSTIGRELQRAERTRSTYRATRGQHMATQRARQPRRPRKLIVHGRLRAYVHTQLAQRWSPEQIAKRLLEAYPDDPTMRVSHETIYTYLYVLPRGELKRELLRALRHRRKHRQSRRRSHDRRGSIPDMLSIEERPVEVADRTVPGHWEGDLLMGRRHASALGTLVERTTRTTLLVPLRAKDATSVRRAFAREMQTLPQQMARSLTYDRGKEMAEHKLFTQQTRIQVYFAHPHSPWERGTNENTNGLIRQFFPKGTDFSTVSRREIKHIQTLLNGRPRKVLNWRTPSEVFHNVPIALET
jgi:transposase, IS30 family